MLVAKDGETLFAQAYGLADRDKGIPNRLDTKFNLGSVGKTFTGVAIAQLAHEEKISFGDPVGKYVSGLPTDIADKVTIEQLLTHTSGLGDFMTREYHANKDNVRTIPEFMRYVVNQPLRFEPGKAHQYSNAGYVLLGAVIEAVTGMSYYDYIREHVLEPAGMKDTDFYEKDAVTPNLARGCHPAGMPTGLKLLPPLEGPGGGERTNPESGPGLKQLPPLEGPGDRRQTPPEPGDGLQLLPAPEGSGKVRQADAEQAAT